MAFFTVLCYWRVPLQRFRIQLGWEHGLSKKVPLKNRAITEAQAEAKVEGVENRFANVSHHSRHGQKLKKLASEVFKLDVEPSKKHEIAALVSTAFDYVDEDDDRKLGASVRQGARQGGQKRSNEHAPRRELWQSIAEDIWSKSPSLSKAAVARLIAIATDHNPDTIRQRIRKPTKT